MRYFNLMMLLIMTNLSYAQWPKVFGANSNDMIGRSIIESYDHGVIFTGAERLSSNSSLIGYIYKTDINGYFLWKRYINYFDPLYNTNVLGVNHTADGGLIISGQVMKNITTSDGFYMKLNACGEKEWCGIVNIPGYTYCDDNLILPDGSFILHGEESASNHHRIWLYKITPSGEFDWKKEMEIDSAYFNETAWKMNKTIDSNIIFTGFAHSIREDPEWGWETPLWVKFDYDGNELWDLPWITETHEMGQAYRIIQDKNGTNLSTGYYDYHPGQVGCIYRFSADGVKQCYHTFEGFGDGSALYAINFFPDSTLFLGGAYGIGQNGYSMVIKSDTAGNLIKSKSVPLYGMPVGYSVTTFDQKILGLGERPQETGYFHWETCLFKFNQNLDYDSSYSIPINYDSLCSDVVVPQVTIDLDCQNVSVSDCDEAIGSSLVIYPNPAKNWITITLPKYYIEQNKHNYINITTTFYHLSGEIKIEIVNIHGQQLFAQVLDNLQTSLNIDISNWSPDIYLIRLINKNKVRAQGKLIKIN